jgi:uncharacterized membrane protein YcaP (DUF421 family)
VCPSKAIQVRISSSVIEETGEKKKKNSDQLIHELPRQKEKKTAEAFYYHASNEQVAVTIWFQSRI